MGIESAWPNWIDRPILIRLHDLINEVQRPDEEIKQTLIDAANQISDLANEDIALEDDDDEDDRCEECGYRAEPGQDVCDDCRNDREYMNAADAAGGK